MHRLARSSHVGRIAKREKLILFSSRAIGYRQTYGLTDNGEVQIWSARRDASKQQLSGPVTAQSARGGKNVRQ